LNVEGAGGQQLGGQRAVEFVKPGRVIQWGAGDRGGLRHQRVDTEEGFRRLVVPLHQSESVGFAKGALPAVVEPIRMRVKHRRRQVRDVIQQALARGGGAAQHGIDEAADVGLAGFHGFIDGGVVGQIQDQQLAEADAQDIAGFRIEFAIAEFADPVV